MMCSIPGLPTPGTELSVVIRRVNLNSTFGLVELWVNLDDGRKHIYEQLREEIQTPGRKFYESEGKPGDLCLVCISETWHRARIVSIQSEACNVFLIDQGQPHITTREALAWPNSDSFLVSPETESCILANVLSAENSCPETATKFLVSLPGKKFKGLVQHVLMPDRTILLDIPIVSKHMCKFGGAKKMPVDEFKCLVQKSLEADRATKEQNLSVSCQLEKADQYFYPELSTDSYETIKVTNVVNPHNIFCQLLIMSKAVEISSELIQKHYEEGSDFGETRPLTCGDPCSARGVNGRWHRSILKQSMISNGAVEVLHVDEGKTELVQIGDIRPLHGKFLKMPVVTYRCSLDGVKDDGTGWSTDQIDHLKSLLLNKTIVAKFNHHNIPQEVYHVILYNNTACINSCFLEKAGPFSPSKTEADSDVQIILSSFLTSNGDEHHMDLQNNINVNVDGLVEETSQHNKYLTFNGRTDDVPPSDSAGELLTPTSAKAEAQIPPVPSDAYEYSTHNIEVDGEEKVWVTSSKSVSEFYCQLDRNSHLLDKVTENVKRLICQPECADHPLGLDSICFARYTDNQWYRGQVVEMSPKLKVHFVDYGQTLALKDADICPFPAEASIARSVPVLAVPLGLFGVPAEVPREVNKWFEEHAVGHSFTISVVAKGEKGKLMVELFDGPLNVNVEVRKMTSKMMPQEMTGHVQQTDQLLSNSSQHASVPNELHSQSTTVSAHEMTLDDGRKQTSDAIPTNNKKGGHSHPKMSYSLPACPEGNMNICMYKWPKTSQNKTEEVYASSIVGPNYFWCQYANMEELNKMSRLAQEAGRAQADATFPDTLEPGSPCLALFSSDNQWYRAKVISRVNNTFNVVFIDYGNESDVDVKNVKPLPRSLMEKAPRAFMCSLDGFNESKGSWEDDVYDDFYNCLVDKPLRVTVFNKEDHPELMVPQYAIKIECDNVVMNTVMQKYWKPFPTEHAKTELTQKETFLEDIQTQSNMTHLNVSKGNGNTCVYKKPNISKNNKEEVYASCIVEPHFFWCQFANTEELNKLSRFAQEAGWAQENAAFPDTLGPGSPCLALFSSDNQWYRARVISRIDDTFNVVFIDYGNESDVDTKNVRPLPESLLDEAPQAFLCSLNGFDKSRGSWVDDVHDDFYNLLVDKPLRVTVVSMDDHSETPQYAVVIECEGAVVNAAMQKYWKPVAKKRLSLEHSETESFLQDGQTESNMTHLSVSKGDLNTCMYKEPNIFPNKTEIVYASSLAEPNYFWCQYANTEELNKLSRLAQEAGQAQEDATFPETLGTGSPCLALFSSDNQWYRAKIISRVDDTFNVVFIDYGNECDVDIKNVRPLPQSLLDKAPQAFLCTLNGFDKSGGSWNDEVYDDFYNLLVDKLLKLKMINMDKHSEIAEVPKYTVEVECEGVLVNKLLEKYWDGQDTDCALEERLGSVYQGD